MRHLALAALLSAVPVRAQIVPGSASEAAVWVRPMAAAVSAAGSERVGGLGFTSLSALSSLDAKGRFPFVAAPDVLAPLVQAMRAQGHTPESFAALATTEKLDVLAKAAPPAEAHAAAVADEALAAVVEPVRIGTYKDAARKVASAREVSLYLSSDRAERLAAAGAAVAAYEKKREELIEAFLHDLPGKIAAGEFDGANIVRRDQDGWYAADERPEQRYETLSRLYAARLDRLGRAPAGPWTVREADLMKTALENPEIADALTREHQEAPSAIPSLADIRRSLDERRLRARELTANTPKLAAALARFEKGAPRGTDIREIEKYYDSALNRTGFDWTVEARILGWIRTGGDGLPGWEEMKALKRAVQGRYHRNALAGMVSFIGALAASAAVGVSDWPTPFKLAAAALMFAPMIWMFVNIWRRDAFNFEADSVDMRLNR